MELPKLTKEIAKQIDDNYQKFLKNEELKEALREDDMLKAKALAEYLGVDVEDIENTGIDLYKVDGDEYLVLTDEEATEKAEEEIQNVFDDLGLDSFTDSFKEWIMNNCVSTGKVYDWMLDSYRSYVDDIELENDYTFGNRLIQELYDNGLLEDEDFEVEDGEILYDELRDSSILDSKKEEYANQLASTMDPMDWLKEIYSEKDLAKLIVDEDMIDMEALIEECIRLDGRGHFIAYYDGNELDLGNGLFAYQVN